jgi:hypothetical protein
VRGPLPGAPSTTGAPAGAFALPPRNAFQFGTSADVSWHSQAVDVSAGAGYNRGREGGYQSLNGTLKVRIKW